MNILYFYWTWPTRDSNGVPSCPMVERFAHVCGKLYERRMKNVLKDGSLRLYVDIVDLVKF